MKITFLEIFSKITYYFIMTTPITQEKSQTYFWVMIYWMLFLCWLRKIPYHSKNMILLRQQGEQENKCGCFSHANVLKMSGMKLLHLFPFSQRSTPDQSWESLLHYGILQYTRNKFASRRNCQTDFCDTTTPTGHGHWWKWNSWLNWLCKRGKMRGLKVNKKNHFLKNLRSDFR